MILTLSIKSFFYSIVDPAAAEGVVAVAAGPVEEWAEGIVADYSSAGPRNKSKFTAVSITKPDITAPTDVSVFCHGLLCEKYIRRDIRSSPPRSWLCSAYLI